jgi:hypothetical protein
MDGYKIDVHKVFAEGMGHTDNDSSSFYGNLLLKAVKSVGAQLKINIQRATKLLSEIAKIEAQSIGLTDDYVTASMEQPRVQAWLGQGWGRHRIFMVCAILIARPKGDSSIDISTESNTEMSGQAQADATAAQVPAEGRAEMGGTFAKEFGLAYVPKTAFVYGFKVRECFYKKAVDKHKAYFKGAKMHLGAENKDRNEVSEERKDLSEDKVEAKDDSRLFISAGVSKEDLELSALGDMEDDFEHVVMDNDATSTLLVPKSKRM